MYVAARKSNPKARTATVVAIAATKEEVFEALDALEDAGEDVGACIALGDLGRELKAMDSAPVVVGSVVAL